MSNVTLSLKTKLLKSQGEFLRGRGISRGDLQNEGLPAVLYGDLYTRFDGTISSAEVFISSKTAAGSTEIRFGDILFPTAGETSGEIAKPSVYLSKLTAYAGGDIIVFRPHDPLISAYLVLALRTHEAYRYRHRMAQGQSIVHISQRNLEDHPLLVADMPCAEKISQLVSAWDHAIELTKKLFAAKQKEKQALLQHVYRNCKGKLTQLSEVLARVRHPVAPEATKKYRQIGIRSHGKGIFHKPSVTGASLGNKKVYEIKPDCFVFNVVFAWEQAVARTTSQEVGMIASHRFPMYEPIDDLVDIDFLLYFFKTKRGKHLLGLASPGGAGRNRTLSQTAFLKLKVILPSKIDQSRYAELLLTADCEISLLKKRLKKLKQQKKGLMQRLLSGKVRVKLPKVKGKK